MRPATVPALDELRKAGFLVFVLAVLFLFAALPSYAAQELSGQGERGVNATVQAPDAAAGKPVDVPSLRIPAPVKFPGTDLPQNLDIRYKHFYDSLTTFFREFDRLIAPDQLTVENCIMIARENSNEVAASESRSREAADKIDEVKSQQNPTLGLSGTYYTLGPIPQFTIPGFGAPLKIMNEVNYDLKFVSQYLISSFGTVETAKKIACLNYMQARVGEDRVTSDLYLGVLRSFFTIVEKKGYVAVAEQAIAAKSLQLKLAKDNYEAGMFPRFEVIQADVGLKDAELLVIRAAKELEMEKARMRNLLGLDQTVEFDIKRPRFKTYPLPAIEEALQAALENRPEITQINLAVDIATANVDLAYSGKNPALLFVTTYDYQTANFASMPSQWNVALNFQVPIFDGGLTWAKVRQAKEALEQAELARNQLKRDIALQVKNSHLSVMESAKKFVTADSNIESATEAYEIAVTRYQEGLSTNLELNNAVVNYLTAHAALLSAYCEYQRSWAALVHAMGLSLKGVYYELGAHDQ